MRGAKSARRPSSRWRLKLGALAQLLGDDRLARVLPVLADVRRFLDERRG